MGQLTREFVEQMKADAYAGKHTPLTCWEQEQLAFRWLLTQDQYESAPRGSNAGAADQLARLRAIIAADRCDGDTDYAAGANAAQAKCLAAIDQVVNALGPDHPKGAAEDQQDAVRLVWPKERDVKRPQDMGPGHLRVLLDNDNDVIVEVWTGARSAAVEFCNPGACGGGRSRRTRIALVDLMTAIEADNAETPLTRQDAAMSSPVEPAKLLQPAAPKAAPEVREIPLPQWAQTGHASHCLKRADSTCWALWFDGVFIRCLDIFENTMVNAALSAAALVAPVAPADKKPTHE